MTRSPTRRALAVALALGAAIGLATCADGITGPGRAQRASFSFAPQFASSAHSAMLALADAGLPLDRVRIVLVRPVHDTLKDTTITMHEGDPAVSLELTVVAQPNETLDAGLQFKSGETVLFEGHASVVTTAKVGSGGKPANITVVYVGPGAAATKVVVTPTQGSYSTDGTIQFHADAQDATGASLANTPFTWSLSDASLGTISSSGLLTPSGKRGTVTVTATTPVPLTGNASATFFLPAASITIVSGSGQTGTISTSLAQPLVAQVSAADGLGVPGVSVVFSSSAVGASFSPATAITDANGRVSTTVRLGSQAGAQDLAATAGTFVVHAAATATGGPAAAMFAVGPAAFTITSGVVPTTASAAKIVDAGGGAVANASAQVVITQGTSSTTTAATSDANGLITVPSSFALTAKAGDYTLTISSDGLSGSPVSFSMSVVPGAPAKLALKTAPSSSVQNGVAFPVQPIIQLLDVNGNEVAKQGVIVTVSIDVPILGGTTTATTSANGSAAFTNLSISGVAGARVLTFGATGLTSVTGTTTMTGTGVPGLPVRMAAIAGIGQKDTVGTVLAVAPAVQVLDGNGNGVPGVAVMFAVTGGQGSIPAALVVTDSHGVASTPWALGTVPGLNVLTATAMDTTGAGVGFTGFTVGGGTLHVATFAGNPVTFNATALTGHAVHMSKLGVDEAVSTFGGQSLFPIISVTDAYGNPVDNITVTFSVVTGAGLQTGSLFDGVNPVSSITTTTFGGLAYVEWDLALINGTNQLSATASGVGSANIIGNPVVFSVLTLPSAPPPMSPAKAPVVTSIPSPKKPPTLTP